MSEPLRILLIDDNPDDRLLAIRELRREFPDLQAEQISEAKGFAQALEAGDFDLVITDYQLRWTDGVAVLRASKARCPDCPVIMFTATGNEEIAVQAMKNSLADYILKSPKHFIRLPAAVRLALKQAEDITERRRAEESLRDSESRFRQFFENEPAFCYIVSPEGTVLDVNRAALKALGYEKEELIGQPLRAIYAPESLSKMKQVFAKWQQTGALKDVEMLVVTKEGDRLTVLLSASAVRDEAGKLLHSISVQQDITERVRAEEATKLAYAELDQIFNTSADGMRVVDSEFNVLRANETFSTLSGLRQDEVVGIKCYEVFSGPSCHTADCPLNRILGGEEHVEYDIEKQRNDGTRIPCIVTATPFRAPDGKLIGMVEDFKDITDRKRREEELRRSHDKLRRALDQTVGALAAAVEARDPYTAGHQRRVANLASAVAREMGLSDDQIDAIHVFGLIHDIGKIQVPASILSKPSRLTEPEMKMVRTHSQAGYDILGTVDFPWPVCEIVLQHHERMDGSGYPQGLSGEEILLEARILAVADVVEAMASHRPYRPALGIDKALEEIRQNRGILYDPGVVDACLKLHTEKGFQFE